MDKFLSKIDHNSLRMLFSQAPLALAMIKGEELIIAAANEKMLELWGKSPDVIGRKILDGIPELKVSKFPALLRHVLKTGDVYKGIGEMLVLNGKESYFDFTYAPVYEHDQIIAVSVVATEVSNRIISERKLLDSEIRFRDLILNADVPTAIYLGENLVISLANEKMIQAWGKDEGVIGKKLEEALPELQGQPFIELLKNVLRTGETYSAPEDPVDLIVDGRLQTFYYNFSYKPIRDSGGKIYGILNMAVDVTDQVRSKKNAQQSESFLNSVIQHSPMAISIMKGPEFIISISNDKTRELWGGNYDRIGKKLIDAYPNLAGGQTMANVKKCFESGKQLYVKEQELKNADGSSKFINYILTPLKNNRGETEYIISLGYDVTEDMLLRQKVTASEAQFRTLANQLPQLVWTSDANGYTNYYSDQWYEYTAIPRDQFGDTSWINSIKKEHRKAVSKIWKECVKNGSDYEVEYELEDGKNPGRFRWFLAKAVPIKDQHGAITQWVGSLTDIHEMKQLQSQKDNFLGIASHELKTPLTSIKIYTQLLEKTLRKTGDEKNAGYAYKVDEQVNKLNSLIADLLDVTKIQKGQLQYTENEFDFDTLVKEVVEELQITTKHRLALHHSTAGVAFGDRHRIAQVIINLVNNAIKYSPGADKVIVETRSTAENVVLCVQDFGIGMDINQQEKIFEQFYRVSGDNQHTFPGLGLGLFISSEIIKRAGGRIWVTSTPGKGSSFCFEIPKTKTID